MNHVVAQSSSSGSRNPPDAGISLGLGLTNECNLACAFCYRDPARTDRLSLDQVKSVMERLPIRSVNLGTGENGMHPDFKAILGLPANETGQTHHHFQRSQRRSFGGQRAARLSRH
jgi:MoaA/NifB/PqqE/SkfB family radical SAM enzyme